MAATTPRPKRSVLFVAVTAEEHGLLGSRYFAGDPTVPRAGIVANINMDMFLPLFPMKSVMVLGLDESDLGDRVREVAARSGLARQCGSGAAAESLHAIRSVQLHPSGRAGARDEGRLRAGISGGGDRCAMDEGALSPAVRRPAAAGGSRRGGDVHAVRRRAVGGRSPTIADAAAVEDVQLLQAIRANGGLQIAGQTALGFQDLSNRIRQQLRPKLPARIADGTIVVVERHLRHRRRLRTKRSGRYLRLDVLQRRAALGTLHRWWDVLVLVHEDHSLPDCSPESATPRRRRRYDIGRLSARPIIIFDPQRPRRVRTSECARA